MSTRSADIAEILGRELGAGRVIGAGDDRLADYGRDETTPAMLPEGLVPPACAVLCEDADEVAAVLRI